MTSFLQAFLEGFSGGSLLSWAEMPGAATQVFANDNSDYPQRELTESLLKQPDTDKKQGKENSPSIFDDDFFRVRKAFSLPT